MKREHINIVAKEQMTIREDYCDIFYFHSTRVMFSETSSENYNALLNMGMQR